jgi:arachidonate 5-lipoxygenase
MTELVRYVCFEATGNASLTFRELYNFNGRELCIVVTNVSCMCEEYFHVKTTPDVEIAVALRMSTALPGLLQPVPYNGSLYCDGGLLCNYPIHAFDGWWLSMKKEDSQFKHLSDFKNLSDFAVHSKKFGTEPNPKTLGFTIFSSEEPCRTAGWVCENGGPPQNLPPTLLGKQAAVHQQKAAANKGRDGNFDDSMQAFIRACDEADQNGDGEMDRDELLGILSDTALQPHLMVLFATTEFNAIMAALDANGDGVVTFAELMSFMDEQRDDGIGYNQILTGMKPREVSSVGDFMGTLLETMHMQVEMLKINPADQSRTVAIDTGYITTVSFALEDGDKEYVERCGENATRAFLEQQTRT